MKNKGLIYLGNIKFDIDKDKLIREIRVGKVIRSFADIKERSLKDAINKNIEIAYGLIEGKGLYRTLDIISVEDDKVIADLADDLFVGKSMVKLLSNCKKVTLMVVSIGSKLEDFVELFSSKAEITDSFLLDGIGSMVADQLADRVEEMVISRDMKRSGYKPTMRYSVGYGDWELRHQKTILKLLDAERIPVRLTESDILIPRKSVTAIIGWQEY